MGPRFKVGVAGLSAVLLLATAATGKDIPWKQGWDEQDSRPILEAFGIADRELATELCCGLPAAAWSESTASTELRSASAGTDVGSYHVTIGEHSGVSVFVGDTQRAADDCFGRCFVSYFSAFDPVPRVVTGDEVGFNHGEYNGAVLTGDGRIRQLVMLRRNVAVHAFLATDRLLDDLDQPDPAKPTIQWWFDLLGTIDQKIVSGDASPEIPAEARPQVEIVDQPDEIVYDENVGFSVEVQATASVAADRKVLAYALYVYGVGYVHIDHNSKNWSDQPTMGWRCGPEFRPSGRSERPEKLELTVVASDDRGVVGSKSLEIPLRDANTDR